MGCNDYALGKPRYYQSVQSVILPPLAHLNGCISQTRRYVPRWIRGDAPLALRLTDETRFSNSPRVHYSYLSAQLVMRQKMLSPQTPNFHPSIHPCAQSASQLQFTRTIDQVINYETLPQTRTITNQNLRNFFLILIHFLDDFFFPENIAKVLQNYFLLEE